MKKLFLLFAVLISCISISAQTVMKSKLFDNTYISLGGGVTSLLSPTTNGFENFESSMGAMVDLTIGKNITPIFGLELETAMHVPSKDTKSQTSFDFLNLGINGTFNLNNIFHKYNEDVDKVEFVPFVGVGWFKYCESKFRDDIYGKGGLKINWNLSNKWQLNLVPSITYKLTNNGFTSTSPMFNVNRSFVSLMGGITYKFKNSHGTHNFVICPNSFTQEDLDKINDIVRVKESENDSLNNIILAKDRIIVSERELIDRLNDKLSNTEDKEINIFSVIGFDLGKSDIKPTHKASLINLSNFLKEHKTDVTIIGHADSNTGSVERNLALSKERAESVKEELIKLGVNPEQLKTFGKGSTEQMFQENDANRAAVFVVTK